MSAALSLAFADLDAALTMLADASSEAPTRVMTYALAIDDMRAALRELTCDRCEAAPIVTGRYSGDMCAACDAEYGTCSACGHDVKHSELTTRETPRATLTLCDVCDGPDENILEDR